MLLFDCSILLLLHSRIEIRGHGTAFPVLGHYLDLPLLQNISATLTPITTLRLILLKIILFSRKEIHTNLLFAKLSIEALFFDKFPWMLLNLG